MRRLILLMSLIVLLDLSVWSAVVPLLPHYQSAMGLSTVEIGAVVAAFSVGVVVAAVPAGQLADLMGARRVTAIGVALMAVSTVGLGLVGSFGPLLFVRFVQGTGDATVWSAGLAWVAAASPVEHRGRSVSIVQAAATVGVIAGPFIGGVITSAIGIAPTFYGLAAVLAALAVWALTEPDVDLEPHRRARMLPAVRSSLREPLVAASAVVIVLVAVVGGTLQLLLPLHLSSLGVGRSGIGAVFTAGAIAGAVAVVVCGRWGDRIGRVPLSAGACVALAAVTVLFAAPTGLAVFGLLVILFWTVQAVLYAVGYPLATDGADRAQLGHGIVLGVINLTWGLGSAIGPIAGSKIADLAGARSSYILLAALSMLTAAVVLRTGRFVPVLADR